ncbi:MAG: UDP-glucose 4-epimerase GalE [Mycoplasmataceae bacterium]|nr:UDP-glucose 4-epimerase GalE [Mycoplasmataceae bacterium]
MKVLVTGGLGYIGSHAVYLLIEKGYDVIVLDNLTNGSKNNIHPKAKYYYEDIRDYQKIKDIFEKEKDICAIMHFAGLIVVPESVKEPLKYFDVNTNGVLNLLNVIKDYDSVKTFIFSSTAAVYGEPKFIPIKEDDVKEPINPYGQSKLAAEQLICSWAKAYNKNYVIFRYFNVAGAHEIGKIGIWNKQLTHLVPLIIESKLTETVFNIFGNDYDTKDGTCIRDFVHVNDLVNAHILGMEWSIKNNLSDVFNLGTGQGYSVKEVFDKSKEVLDSNIKVNIQARRLGDPAKLYSDTSKVQKILNWKPEYTLEKIILTEYNFRKNKKN